MPRMVAYYARWFICIACWGGGSAVAQSCSGLGRTIAQWTGSLTGVLIPYSSVFKGDLVFRPVIAIQGDWAGFAGLMASTAKPIGGYVGGGYRNSLERVAKAIGIDLLWEGAAQTSSRLNLGLIMEFQTCQWRLSSSIPILFRKVDDLQAGRNSIWQEPKTSWTIAISGSMPHYSRITYGSHLLLNQLSCSFGGNLQYRCLNWLRIGIEVRKQSCLRLGLRCTGEWPYSGVESPRWEIAYRGDALLNLLQPKRQSEERLHPQSQEPIRPQSQEPIRPQSQEPIRPQAQEPLHLQPFQTLLELPKTSRSALKSCAQLSKEEDLVSTFLSRSESTSGPMGREELRSVRLYDREDQNVEVTEELRSQSTQPIPTTWTGQTCHSSMFEISESKERSDSSAFFPEMQGLSYSTDPTVFLGVEEGRKLVADSYPNSTPPIFGEKRILLCEASEVSIESLDQPTLVTSWDDENQSQSLKSLVPSEILLSSSSSSGIMNFELEQGISEPISPCEPQASSLRSRKQLVLESDGSSESKSEISDTEKKLVLEAIDDQSLTMSPYITSFPTIGS